MIESRKNSQINKDPTNLPSAYGPNTIDKTTSDYMRHEEAVRSFVQVEE